jgi:hypothetical protein
MAALATSIDRLTHDAQILDGLSLNLAVPAHIRRERQRACGRDEPMDVGVLPQTECLRVTPRRTSIDRLTLATLVRPM